MKIHAIADTHMSHEEVHLPGGDILIVAGDILGYGFVNEAAEFNRWLGKQRYGYKIVTPGNHDICLNDPMTAKQLISNGILLHHEATTIAGINFFGSPWTPMFCDWEFMYEPGSEHAEKLWAAIPDNTDILITHGPAHGTKLGFNTRHEDCGCYVMRDRINKLPNLKAHIFGHIHCGYGTDNIGNIKLYNASVVDEMYDCVNKPLVVEWK